MIEPLCPLNEILRIELSLPAVLIMGAARGGWGLRGFGGRCEAVRLFWVAELR